jgi:hypothetical protein
MTTLIQKSDQSFYLIYLIKNGTTNYYANTAKFYKVSTDINKQYFGIMSKYTQTAYIYGFFTK